MKKVFLSVSLLSLIGLFILSCDENKYGDLTNKSVIIIENAKDHIIERYKEGAASINKKWSIYELEKGTTCESLGFIGNNNKTKDDEEFIIKKYTKKDNDKLICTYVTFTKYSYNYGTISKLMTIGGK